MRVHRLTIRLLLLVGGAMPAVLSGAEPVNYVRDVKPLLTQHCSRCHGESKQEGGLRLDTAAYLDEGGVSGRVLVPGKGANSLLVQVLQGPHDDIPRMPYKKTPLAAAEIALLKAWVDQGAGGAPDDEKPGKYLHWSFIPPARAPPPAVKRADWPRNPIDQFVLARLEGDKIKPSPEAERTTLLRRLSLDLIGLPPTPAEIDAFLQDRKPGAYERVVDRLLGSPHYGERWGRLWLDVARYADSNGYSVDSPRQIWKYRDWVVEALNRDLPYDQFVIEQLAGDLLPGATVEQKVATGFNRNTQINGEGGTDPEQFRIEAVLDRVNTFGTAFLGLTVACAQCHDHKFDPIQQSEYYQLYAFFNNTEQEGHGGSKRGGVLPFAGEFDSEKSPDSVIEEARAAVAAHIAAHESAAKAWLAELTAEMRSNMKPKLREAVGVPWEQQTFAQKRIVFDAFQPEDSEYQARNGQLSKLERGPQAVTTLVMSELPEPRESFLFIKGDFTRRGKSVAPGTPAVLPPIAGEKLTRLDLARWLVDSRHPLTARVLVNRTWQQYFGLGLVETENDFGTQGSLPTHPELLDWLATEVVAQRWSMKALHRIIVTSATYRQSSRARPDLEISDPRNLLLARQARLRLDGELIRDVALTASGKLSPRLGGPPVFPPQPEGAMSLGQVRQEWPTSIGANRYRRALYTHVWRATPHPALAVFDGPDGVTPCTRRLRSNTPLQSLTLLNDQQFYEFAVALAERVRREAAAGDLGAQVDWAFRLCLARLPTAKERTRLMKLLGPDPAGSAGNAAEGWTTVARVLLNLDETITRE